MAKYLYIFSERKLPKTHIQVENVFSSNQLIIYL